MCRICLPAVWPAARLSDNVWHHVDSYTITGDNLQVETGDGLWYCSYQCNGDGSAVIYEFTADRNGFMCLDLNVTDKNNYTVYKNGSELYSESMTLQQMIAVSDVQVGDQITVRVKCKNGESGEMTVKAAIMNSETFAIGYEVLNASTLNLTEFSNTLIEGTIHCNRDGILYTSIPQDGNWKVYVNDVAVEPVLIGNAMIGVELPAGDYQIQFRYENSAFQIGWKISLVCFLAFCVTLCLYHPNRRRGKYEKR